MYDGGGGQWGGVMRGHSVLFKKMQKNKLHIIFKLISMAPVASTQIQNMIEYYLPFEINLLGVYNVGIC